ncbi:MAG: hypothetical protein JO017_02890 [Actinobacteria bacterium]|nr:hypothetical protein [Actinomycetota bacterium]
MSAWLAAAYAVLALGVAWVLIGGGSWKRRAPFVVLAPALALGLWLGRADPAGWPTLSGIPKQAGLVWAQIVEPDPATADPGRIYLWLDTGKPSPRAYSLPYSRPLHEQVQKALQAIRLGDPIEVSRRGQRTPREGRGHGSRAGSPLLFTSQSPVTLPPKA